MWADKVTPLHVASCAAYLPPDGAVAFELNGQVEVWDIKTNILADAANSLRYLFWAKTKDGAKNRRKPRRIEPPQKVGEKPKAYEIDELKTILAKKRKKV